jgi:hypothetical protein
VNYSQVTFNENNSPTKYILNKREQINYFFYKFYLKNKHIELFSIITTELKTNNPFSINFIIHLLSANTLNGEININDDFSFLINILEINYEINLIDKQLFPFIEKMYDSKEQILSNNKILPVKFIEKLAFVLILNERFYEKIKQLTNYVKEKNIQINIVDYLEEKIPQCKIKIENFDLLNFFINEKPQSSNFFFKIDTKLYNIY